MKTAVAASIVLAFFSSGLACAEPGPLFDAPFALLSVPLPAAPAPLFLTDLNWPTPRPTPLVPGSLFLSPLQAAQAARTFIIEGYSNRSLKVRSFSYSSPEQLVNWAAPQVTFLTRVDSREYHGPAWQVYFVAPRRPDASSHMDALPGDDFDILVTQDGRALCASEGCD